jgi:hypothetical protein
MPDLKLDPLTGDLALVNGDLALTDDASGETLAQRVTIRARMFKGEWFLDTRLGQDFLREVLKKNSDMTRVAAIMRAVILETPGVARITRYTQTLDRAARKLTVSVGVAGDDGVNASLDLEIGP